MLSKYTRSEQQQTEQIQTQENKVQDKKCWLVKLYSRVTLYFILDVYLTYSVLTSLRFQVLPFAVHNFHRFSSWG